MPVNIKQLVKFEGKEILASGHRMCAGCGAAIFLKHLGLAAASVGVTPIIANATGCVEVTTSVFPETAWKIPWMHSAFENAASTISGIEKAWRALAKKGKVDINKKVVFIALGGDGGTYDIGFQALSGALERRHNFLYIVYDNEAYMNTGYQRSGATPPYANTTTAPVGKAIPGKLEPKKDIIRIVQAHDPVYVAQTTIGYWMHEIEVLQKALTMEGPRFVLVYTPCVPGWAIPENSTMLVSKLAVETGFLPLIEWTPNEGWKWSPLNPKNLKPLEEFLKLQRRFAHLLKPENKELLENFKQLVMERYNLYKKLAGVQ